jgi:hypothetical protein
MKWQSIAAMVVLAVPLAIYITSDTSSIPQGLITNHRCAPEHACFSARSYAIFVMLEFSVPAALLLLMRSRYKLMVLCAVASLIIIPFYHLGLYNDFAMRVSLPALAVIAMLTPAVLLSARKKIVVLMAVWLLAGAITPLGEIYRGINGGNSPVSEKSTFPYESYLNPSFSQYFGKVPSWLIQQKENTGD